MPTEATSPMAGAGQHNAHRLDLDHRADLTLLTSQGQAGDASLAEISEVYDVVFAHAPVDHDRSGSLSGDV